MDGTSCRQTNVSPTLCFNASHTVSGSTPPLTPSVNASPIAAALMNQIWLVTSFTTLPVPSAPQWMTLPSGANSAPARSRTAGSPPTKSVSLPFLAPSTAPVTGDSRVSIPRASAMLASSSTSARSLVVRSIQSAPDLSSANTGGMASRDCFGPGSEVINTSTSAASSVSVDAIRAPTF